MKQKPDEAQEENSLRMHIDQHVDLSSQISKLQDECATITENECKAKARLELITDEVRQLEQKIRMNIERRILDLDALDRTQIFQRDIDALKQEEAGLQLLVDSADGAIYSRDTKLTALRRKLEYSREEIGRDLLAELHKTAPEGIDDYFLNVLAAASLIRELSDLPFALSGNHKITFEREEVRAALPGLYEKFRIPEVY